jgi:hypothetical protein
MGGTRSPETYPFVDRGTADRSVLGERGRESGSAEAVAAGIAGLVLPGGPWMLSGLGANAASFGAGTVAGAFGGTIPDDIEAAFAQAGGLVYISTGAFLLHQPDEVVRGAWDGVVAELQDLWNMASLLLSPGEWPGLLEQLGRASQVLFAGPEMAFAAGWEVGKGLAAQITSVLRGPTEGIAYGVGKLLGPLLLDIAGTLLMGAGAAKFAMRFGKNVTTNVVDTLATMVRTGRAPTRRLPPQSARGLPGPAGAEALPSRPRPSITMSESPRERPSVEMPDSPGPLDQSLDQSPLPGRAAVRISDRERGLEPMSPVPGRAAVQLPPSSRSPGPSARPPSTDAPDPAWSRPWDDDPFAGFEEPDIQPVLTGDETAMRTTQKKRYRSLGGTPGRDSRVGKIVQERMREEGKLIGEGDNARVKGADGKWYPIKECDMGHIDDAVRWWNREGYKLGPRSEEVHRWMNRAENYELEPRSLNRSKGAKVGQTYRPPDPEAWMPDDEWVEWVAWWDDNFGWRQ